MNKFFIFLSNLIINKLPQVCRLIVDNDQIKQLVLEKKDVRDSIIDDYIKSLAILNDSRQREREAELENFIYNHPAFTNVSIIEGGRFNFISYELESGEVEFPKITYYINDKSLYIVLCDKYDCNYTDAKREGLDLEIWKEKQREYNCLLTVKSSFTNSKFIIIPWDREVTQYLPEILKG